MLFVHFQLGPHRYALDARTVVEVLPLLELQARAASPARPGRHFPLSRATRARPRPLRPHPEPPRARTPQHPHPHRPTHQTCGPASSRAHHRRAPSPGFTRRAATRPLIGLIAERVAGTLQRDEKDFVNVGVETGRRPLSGPRSDGRARHHPNTRRPKTAGRRRAPAPINLRPEASSSPPLPLPPAAPSARGEG